MPNPDGPAVRATSFEGSLLDRLLVSFTNVFAKPTGLPPQHGHDHAIILNPGTSSVEVQLYRYPATHKDKLEWQCAALIKQRIVCRSNSSFSSPVLLVKKADSSWRFCVDYRALNALTVKDTFPILVIDELLDELHGARFFTKLDLWSGYQQLCM